MKRAIIALIFSMCMVFAQAQDSDNKVEYTHSLQGVSWVKISSSATVTVKTHNSSEILIRSKKPEKRPDKARGLKAIYAAGDDNTGIAFYVQKEGSDLIVKNLKNGNRGKVEIFLPKGQNVSVMSTGLGHINISGFSSEIEANSGSVGRLSIKDVTGPITATSSTGDIEVIFSSVNQSSPISITTSTADVDVTMPANTRADLKMTSSMGDIYTNFDIDLPKTDKDGLKRLAGGQKAVGKINNGGVQISLRSSTGDIYLRKK
ncbi:DUF4097 family beta strand repeat protein [Leptobacterium flavescens]|uniref:DUF4097 family beta strand repeat protein n=1 Tax=Leptobacterium flavescens TaxID=472055 RepID=A0A6P0UMD1_9FLAO|nr:DUF4097 family beta strand repeat-containing protein [Leptobacterium flavescens]NER13610.1 DUF4097 family beta strand repeat protein [Leptobacterium flavescens]